MINPKTQQRELAYVTIVDDIEPIVGSDNCECAIVGGWHIMVRKGQFNVGDPAIYFEIDSKVNPNIEAFSFLAKRNYKIKTQKFTFGGKGNFISQGLLMHPSDFGWVTQVDGSIWIPGDGDHGRHDVDDESRFLTKILGVTYADAEDNQRKATVNKDKKYQSMAARHQKLFKKPFFRWMMRRNWGRKILFIFFGKKKDTPKAFPTKFPYVKKTDQERCENMIWVLKDKTPYIRTQKCDGSSVTLILERLKGKNKFEFYVCSRNVRMLKPDQECFYGDDNFYWEVAIKYDIENKLKDYLNKHPELQYVCWQGEVCAPKIQANAHKLSETHLYLFHMIDSVKGFYDIRDAKKIWEEYNMEHVPIDEELYIMPDDFEEFKATADGYYNPSVCEGKNNIPREGYVYYKTTDPNFSFKNVSRQYLLKHNS